MNTTRDSRRAKGLCIQCGINPPKIGALRCEDCAAADSAFTRNYYSTLPKKSKEKLLETAVEKSRKFRKEHPKEARASQIRSQKKLRLEILSHYGRDGKPVCVCCGEENFLFLTLDHINGNGNKERKEKGTVYNWLRKAGFPPGYRTLCYNCNCGRHRNGGVCPHQDPA